MTRSGIFVGSVIAGAAALSFGVYAMSYEVERLEQRTNALNRDLALQREKLRVLEAEWSYLNQPARLQNLAIQHLNLAPVPASRISSLSDLPFRVAAQPAEGRDPLPRPTPSTPSAHTVPEETREGP